MIAKGNFQIGLETYFGADWQGQRCFNEDTSGCRASAVLPTRGMVVAGCMALAEAMHQHAAWRRVCLNTLVFDVLLIVVLCELCLLGPFFLCPWRFFCGRFSLVHAVAGAAALRRRPPTPSPRARAATRRTRRRSPPRRPPAPP